MKRGTEASTAADKLDRVVRWEHPENPVGPSCLQTTRKKAWFTLPKVSQATKGKRFKVRLV